MGGQQLLSIPQAWSALQVGQREGAVIPGWRLHAANKQALLGPAPVGQAVTGSTGLLANRPLVAASAAARAVGACGSGPSCDWQEQAAAQLSCSARLGSCSGSPAGWHCQAMPPQPTAEPVVLVWVWPPSRRRAGRRVVAATVTHPQSIEGWALSPCGKVAGPCPQGMACSRSAGEMGGMPGCQLL